MTEVEEKSLIYGSSRIREIAAIKAVFGFLSITFCLGLVTVLNAFLPAKQNKKAIKCSFLQQYLGSRGRHLLAILTLIKTENMQESLPWGWQKKIWVRSLLAYYTINRTVTWLWGQAHDALYYTGVFRGVQKLWKRKLLLFISIMFRKTGLCTPISWAKVCN